MANLKEYFNIYADLAQGAYNGRPQKYSFPHDRLTPEKKKEIETKKHATFHFPNAKDAHGNDASTVYLQPDNTVKTIKEKNWVGREKVYKKGLLTDEKAGYNSYYVTDTPTLSPKTQHTYFTTRGSDGVSMDVKKGWSGNNLNDWVNNNGSFTLFNAYLPQAKLANEAMHQKIMEMSAKAPNATMSITGHSLGTMISIQAVANLPQADLAKIDKVVLFQGPDARESINKMSQQAQENIQQLEEQGKIDYYVNAFDIVSMLNRNKKGVDEIGRVHYLLPKTFTTTFDLTDKYGSSHDFGQYQLNPDGTPKEANLKEHGYIFAAGVKVSKLIDKYLGKIMGASGESLAKNSLQFLLSLLSEENRQKIIKEYEKIIHEAKIASQWQGKVSRIQKSLASASGSQKIELRSELAELVAKQAQQAGKEYELLVKNILQEAEDEVQTVSKEIRESAMSIRQYLSYAEVQAMIAPYEKSRLWDSAEATNTSNQAKQYKQKLTDFSGKLTTVAKNIQAYDQQARSSLFQK
jgi:ribosome recycling factor